MTEPILYRHFSTKQEFFIAIVRSVSAQTIRGWNDLSEKVNDPSEQIAQGLRSDP